MPWYGKILQELLSSNMMPQSLSLDSVRLDTHSSDRILQPGHGQRVQKARSDRQPHSHQTSAWIAVCGGYSPLKPA